MRCGYGLLIVFIVLPITLCVALCWELSNGEPTVFTQYFTSLLPSALQISAALFALLAITKWRYEHIGRKQIDLAEETLTLFYAAKSAISDIRSPFNSEEEGRTRKKEIGETPEIAEQRDKAYVAIERIKRHLDTFNKLNSLRFQFMAIFGKKYEQEFLEIQKILNEIAWHSRWYHNQTRNDEKSCDDNKWKATIWEHSEDDKINKRINSTIKTIETVCEKILPK